MITAVFQVFVYIEHLGMEEWLAMSMEEMLT